MTAREPLPLEPCQALLSDIDIERATGLARNFLDPDCMLHIRRDEHELIAKALLQLWKSLETALREINRLAEGEKEFSAEESCFRMAAKIVRALCRRPPSAREETVETAYCSRLIIAAKAQAYEEAIWLVEMIEKYGLSMVPGVLNDLRTKSRGKQ